MFQTIPVGTIPAKSESVFRSGFGCFFTMADTAGRKRPAATLFPLRPQCTLDYLPEPFLKKGERCGSSFFARLIPAWQTRGEIPIYSPVHRTTGRNQCWPFPVPPGCSSQISEFPRVSRLTHQKAEIIPGVPSVCAAASLIFSFPQ